MSSNNKVWVGSIPQSVTDRDLRNIMEKYGVVTQLYYRQITAGNTNRGWAFVTFATRDQALNTIHEIDGKLTFPDSDRPVEARFAHTEGSGDKHSSSNPATSSHGTSSLPQSNLSYTTVTLSASPMSITSGGNALPPAGTGGPPVPPPATTIPPVYLWQQYTLPSGHAYFYNTMTGHTQWEKPILTKEMQAIIQNNINTLPQPHNVSLTQNLQHHMTHLNNPIPYAPNATKPTTGSGGKSYGPPGSNLFIFHLPSEWSDPQLKEYFNFFGNIVSCRISKDDGGRNSGFGFVSFDNQASAFAAIRCMNGLGVGQKFLKVQLKKGEEHLLPPDLANAINK